MTALHVCERLRAMVEGYPWHGLQCDLNVTISFGVIEGSASCDYRQLLRAADGELYRAKHNGRNRVESPLQ